jgi:hypothetical protein
MILSAEGINKTAELPVVIGVQILDRDQGGLLSVRIEPHGWASMLTIEAVLRVGLMRTWAPPRPRRWKRSSGPPPCSTWGEHFVRLQELSSVLAALVYCGVRMLPYASI